MTSPRKSPKKHGGRHAAAVAGGIGPMPGQFGDDDDPTISLSSFAPPMSPPGRKPAAAAGTSRMSPNQRQGSDGLVSRVSLRHSTMNPGTMPLIRTSQTIQEKRPMNTTNKPPPRQYSNPNESVNRSAGSRKPPPPHGSPLGSPYNNKKKNHAMSSPRSNNNNNNKSKNGNSAINSPLPPPPLGSPYSGTNKHSPRNPNHLKKPIVVEAPLENLPWKMIGMGVMLDSDDRGPAPRPIPAQAPPVPSTRRQPPAQPHRPPNNYQNNYNNNNYNNHNHQNKNNKRMHQQPLPPPHPPHPPSAGNIMNSVGTLMIEVGPGVSKPLRGSEETWKAIEEGRVTITSCISCQIDLNCVEDAEMVVCPDCTMISPVDQTSNNSELMSTVRRHGVGVGVKPEAVRDWVRSNMR